MAKFGLVHIGNCHRGNPDYGGKKPAGANSMDDIQQFAGPIALKRPQIFSDSFHPVTFDLVKECKKGARNAFELQHTEFEKMKLAACRPPPTRLKRNSNAMARLAMRQ
ncbi:hypothetical protein F4827_005014 [Paraburkholderia bannensis]|uniref:Uncharacterized protein n=1 Tax=Paraburkholderia bannensis TaxID=765414 RepID=A0A7W9WVR2_9BURK|nr:MULTISPECIES: hypothetical protein [Paraburkholderia]MBB3259942.1 hypothetical protein [Paraburkholderia sp. WP4_3_2]MBB6105148.1 hypothetical protein [Paraburkholderia bannensis]